MTQLLCTRFQSKPKLHAKSLSEVGAALGASKAAAKMRANRALENLRRIFAMRAWSKAKMAIAVSVRGQLTGGAVTEIAFGGRSHDKLTPLDFKFCSSFVQSITSQPIRGIDRVGWKTGVAVRTGSATNEHYYLFEMARFSWRYIPSAKAVAVLSPLAFSLVELLVVIAGIGSFAALLLPTLSQVRSRSLRTQCQNKLSQLGIGATMYAHEDSGGSFSDTIDVTNDNVNFLYPACVGDLKPRLCPDAANRLRAEYKVPHPDTGVAQLFDLSG